uniref:DNA_pol_B_exo1 domain-containing protein n=1 Tax=Caenorhabditis japonica TaxID=281687 RepID=A0A8R1E4E1_CAEJA
MTTCSNVTDNTMVAPAEYSQTLEESRLLSQSSMDEPPPSEQSGESDIVGLCVASLELLVDTKSPMPDILSDPIVAISLAIYKDVCREATPQIHHLLTLLPKSGLQDEEQDRVLEFPSEIEMLEHVAKLIVEHDVDMLIGYETIRLSWGYFMRRLTLLGTTISMDRMFTPEADNRNEKEKEKDKGEERITVAAPNGRLLISVWKVVRSDLKLRNYDLGSATAEVLRRKIPMLDNPTLMKRANIGRSTVRNDVYAHLLKLSTINVALLIEMNWFLKNAEMARVYGFQFHEVWTRGSQLRVESMLLRLAHRMQFVAPSITHLQRNL